MGRTARAPKPASVSAFLDGWVAQIAPVIHVRVLHHDLQEAAEQVLHHLAGAAHGGAVQLAVVGAATVHQLIAHEVDAAEQSVEERFMVALAKLLAGNLRRMQRASATIAALGCRGFLPEVRA